MDSEYLNECFSYDPLTGALAWRTRPIRHFKTSSACASWNARFAGQAVGSPGGNGKRVYLKCRFAGKGQSVHRLIMMMAGIDLSGMQVDHINGDGTDNRWTNLRATTSRTNNMNIRRQQRCAMGITGVRYDKRKQSFEARIGLDGSSIYLGRFKTLIDAAAARRSAEIAYGFGPSHGAPLSASA